MALQTPLHAVHEALGAKMIPFAGYDMPVRYTGDKQEHIAVREAAGIFDVSHMGEFMLTGPKALELIQQVTSNDASKLVVGKAQYSCLPTHEGGIIDDLIVYRVGEERYLLVVNASNVKKDWDWIQESNKSIGAEMVDISEETALLAVSGPKAEASLQKLTNRDLSEMGTYFCFEGEFNGVENAMVATTGYTGERTFEVFVPNEHAVRMWEDILVAGAEFGLIPTGLGARDTLRLEMGYMLYGNDIDETTSPLEAGLGWITKLKKGPFNGSDKISALKAAGLGRKLVGLELVGRGIPRRGYKIAHEGKEVGEITSGSISPMTGKGIGLGYVPIELSQPNSSLSVLIRDKEIEAQVVKTPFFRKD